MDSISGNRLCIIPASDIDLGSQKCRIGKKVLIKLGAKLGDPAWIARHDYRVLCTLWPRDDDSEYYIQPCSLVSQLNKKFNADSQIQEYIDFSDIELVNSIGNIKSIELDVIVRDYQFVQFWSPHDPDVILRVNNCLRNMFLSEGSEILLKSTKLGGLFGLDSVIVKKLSFKSGAKSCGRMLSSSKIIINGVLSLDRHEQRRKHKKASSVGGLEKELNVITDLIKLPQDRRRINGLKFCKGVLLQGPPGCGKSSLVHEIANACDAYLHIINGSEMYASRPGETEENLANAFRKVEVISREGLCILFLDEVDVLCPSKSHGRSSADQRVISRLLSLIDDVIQLDNITVIGATNQPASVNPALRRPGRLEKEILIGIPNQNQRQQILSAVAAGICISSAVKLSDLAEMTPGFVGADLVSLVQSAHYAAVKHYQDNSSGLVQSNAAKIEVTYDNFKAALHDIVPSTQRGSDILVDYKPISWHDIGGLEEVKVKLKQAVEWPLKHPEAFARLGLSRPKGILLYGPPGCAKTTLVRAAATSCHVTFLAISGGQLYSPYVGDSERKLAQVFQQARAGAPSILFIDELDSVIGSRAPGGRSKGVQERVLSTLLNEMDGIGMKADDIVRSSTKVAEGHKSENLVEHKEFVENADVLLVAATNRPDMLDDAILRPGRIDRIIYVPPPDKQTRENILKVHTRKIPLDDVSVEELAARTDRFTGADLENLCREAALQALSEDGMNADKVCKRHFDYVLQTMEPTLTTHQLNEYSKIKCKLHVQSS